MPLSEVHTPLPWRYDAFGFINGRSDSRVCQFWNKFEEDFPDREANAEFIVRACNSHDDLLNALRNLLHAFPGDYHEPPRHIVEARKAISKGEGRAA